MGGAHGEREHWTDEDKVKEVFDVSDNEIDEAEDDQDRCDDCSIEIESVFSASV